MLHDDGQDLVGQTLKQGEAIAIHMVNDLLCDGSIVEGGGDFVLVYGFRRIILIRNKVSEHHPAIYARSG